MICPATTDRAVAALREDLLERLARPPQLTESRIRISVATASDAMPARELLALAGASEPEPVASRVGMFGATSKR